MASSCHLKIDTCYLPLWASLVAQSIKNPPAMQETQVGSLGLEDLLENGMATHSSILAWRIPGQESLVEHTPWSDKSQTRLSD